VIKRTSFVLATFNLCHFQPSNLGGANTLGNAISRTVPWSWGCVLSVDESDGPRQLSPEEFFGQSLEYESEPEQEPEQKPKRNSLTKFKHKVGSITKLKWKYKRFIIQVQREAFRERIVSGELAHVVIVVTVVHKTFYLSYCAKISQQ